MAVTQAMSKKIALGARRVDTNAFSNYSVSKMVLILALRQEIQSLVRIGKTHHCIFQNVFWPQGVTFAS